MSKTSILEKQNKPRRKTNEEILKAAYADPDAQPITPENIHLLRLMPRSRTIRRSLNLTQEEFAERYRIPIGTLRDWEQGRTEPDQTAQTYLHLIALDPDGVYRTLSRPRPQPR